MYRYNQNVNMGRYLNISTNINYTTSDTEDGEEGGGYKMTAINVYKIRHYHALAHGDIF